MLRDHEGGVGLAHADDAEPDVVAAALGVGEAVLGVQVAEAVVVAVPAAVGALDDQGGVGGRDAAEDQLAIARRIVDAEIGRGADVAGASTRQARGVVGAARANATLLGGAVVKARRQGHDPESRGLGGVLWPERMKIRSTLQS